MSFFRRNPVDFDDEVRAHLAHEEEALRAAGLSAEEARAEARRRFGNVLAARERVYNGRRARIFETLWQDLRFGARLLRRSPGFTLAATLVLSLGIGVNTALFSILNAVFFKPLPVERPEELFYLYQQLPGQTPSAMDDASLEFFTREAGDLAELTSHALFQTRLTIDSHSEHVMAEIVDSNYFDLLGVDLIAGRGFGAADLGPSSADAPMIISHHTWLRSFGASPEAIGRQVRLGGRYFRVVGVAPEGFDGLSDPWSPVRCWVVPGEWGYLAAPRQPVGRLKPGATFEAMQALVFARSPVLRQDVWERFEPYVRAGYPNFVREGAHPIYRVTDVRVPNDPDAKLIRPDLLGAMIAVVGLVLTIAVANLAGLLMARGVSRTGEIAVRRALGARGLRLARQLLTETVLLGTIGGLVSGVVAIALVAAFRTLTPSRFAVDVAIDWRVFVFAVAVSLGAGLLVGVAPAFQSARLNVLQALGAGVVGARRARRGIARWVLVPQVTLALVLLLLAAVHTRALVHIELRDLGYQTDAVVLEIVRGSALAALGAGNRSEMMAESRRFNATLFDRVGDIDGVRAFGLTMRATLPLSAGRLLNQPPLISEDDFNAGLRGRVAAAHVRVSAGYFEAVGIRLLRGRTFDAREEAGDRPAAVISASLARLLWPAGNGLGQRFSSDERTRQWYEVVGIVNDVDPVVSTTEPPPVVYVRWPREAPIPATLVVRGGGDRTALIGDLRAAVLAADPAAEIVSVQTIAEIAGEMLYPRRAAASILATAGLIGLGLACIGLYGVVSYSAAQRVRELGIRSALGAQRRDLIVLLLRYGLQVTAVGLVLGLALGQSALRATAKMYPGLPLIDVLSLTMVPIAIAAVVLLACYLPARRAAAVSPAQVLRGE
jgi:putative ABC transport system permease protein